jgi:hypothetical protein
MKKASRKTGKAASPVGADEILPEYDFSRARRNKFAARYVANSMVVVLEPDVAAVFPTADQANQALRALAGLIQKHGTPNNPSRRGV